jgi:hypothetical protein
VPVALIVLGGAHALSASVQALAPRAQYIWLTPRRFREISGMR